MTTQDAETETLGELEPIAAAAATSRRDEYVVAAIAHHRVGDLPCTGPIRYAASPLPEFSIRAGSVLDAWSMVKRIIPDRLGTVLYTGAMTDRGGNAWSIVDGTAIDAPRSSS